MARKTSAARTGPDKRKAKSVYTDTSNGYKKVYLPRDGKTPPRVVEEDRLKMEKKLGRKLKYNEVVHHEDENKQNNADGNLEVVSRAENNRNRKALKKGKK